MRVDPGFLSHSVLLRIEGFDRQKLLSTCMAQGILLKDIRFEEELSMTLRVTREDFPRLKKAAGNRYRITVLSEKGFRPFFLRMFVRRSTVAGLLLFTALMFYQAAFISEVQIYGYEHLQEAEIRQVLAEHGICEGARKNKDLDGVEAAMYSRFDNLSWIGIEYSGNMASVQIVENKPVPERKDPSQYTHVVADKAGYIEKIIPRNGLRAVEDGTYVKPGDVVITGLMPIVDKTFENREGGFRPVHGEGEVWARILYRFTYYQERFELIRKETGRHLYGISLQLGDFTLDSSDLLWPYDSAVREDKTVFQFVRPLPFSLSVSKVSEVELYKRERSEKEINQLAKAESRQAAKENIPENAQILNNSLKFSPKENIIEVSIALHALEEIGKEQPFSYTPTDSAIKEDTGGTTAFGQSIE